MGSAFLLDGKKLSGGQMRNRRAEQVRGGADGWSVRSHFLLSPQQHGSEVAGLPGRACLALRHVPCRWYNGKGEAAGHGGKDEKVRLGAFNGLSRGFVGDDQGAENAYLVESCDEEKRIARGVVLP